MDRRHLKEIQFINDQLKNRFCGMIKPSLIFLIACIIEIFGTLNCRNVLGKSDDRSELQSLKFVMPDGHVLPREFWTEGKSVIYFGFSHCPDMCPSALTNFGRAALILGPKAKNFRFVFITLDPDRDHPSLLANYVHQFPSEKLVALSPSLESLATVQSLFQIVRKKVESQAGYSIDHSNFIYVLDENLNQLAVYPGGTSATILAKSLREIDNLH